MKFNKHQIYFLSFYLFIVSISALLLVIYLDYDLFKLFNKSYLVDEALKLQEKIKDNYIFFTISYLFFYIAYVCFVPITIPLIVITSIIFNPIIGALVSTLCITIGSSIFFIFFIKANLVSLFNLEKIRNNKITLKLKKNELLSIFLFRLSGGGGLPLIIQNLILFYSKVKFKNFIFGTLIGILPGNLLLSFLGVGIFKGLKILILS
tara:strand:- start:81 stop:701 length:621 start_codon:yes stop_codon:yes gene_type:complete